MLLHGLGSFGKITQHYANILMTGNYLLPYFHKVIKFTYHVPLREIFLPQFGQFVISSESINFSLSDSHQMLEGETMATVEWVYGRNIRDLPPVSFVDLRAHRLLNNEPIHRIVSSLKNKEAKD